LRHCVGSGSYSNSCRNGSTHIISIRRDGLSKGTIELKEERSGNFVFRRPGGRGFVVGQFRGPGNSNPSSDLHGAWHSVVKGVKEETIALCEQSGMSSKERRSLSRFASSLELHTGIPNELLRINCEKIHRHYSERIFAQRNNGIRIPLVEEEAFKALIARYSRSK
jgi:hypothetical protein